jgi:sensor histidine kinase regulating citrate/malate metabolism
MHGGDVQADSAGEGLGATFYAGLGLAIVEECVNSLGGRVEIQSTEQVGTTFTVRIPKKLPPLTTA